MAQCVHLQLFLCSSTVYTLSISVYSLVSISIVNLNLFYVVCFCQNGYFFNTVTSPHGSLCYNFDLGLLFILYRIAI